MRWQYGVRLRWKVGCAVGSDICVPAMVTGRGRAGRGRTRAGVTVGYIGAGCAGWVDVRVVAYGSVTIRMRVRRRGC